MMDPQLHDELNRIEKDLAAIRENTESNWKQSLSRGLLRGAGAVIGTVLTLAIGSWVLSLFGVIPGFGEIAEQLGDILDAQTNTSS